MVILKHNVTNIQQKWYVSNIVYVETFNLRYTFNALSLIDNNDDEGDSKGEFFKILSDFIAVKVFCCGTTFTISVQRNVCGQSNWYKDKRKKQLDN